MCHDSYTCVPEKVSSLLNVPCFMTVELTFEDLYFVVAYRGRSSNPAKKHEREKRVGVGSDGVVCEKVGRDLKCAGQGVEKVLGGVPKVSCKAWVRVCECVCVREREYWGSSQKCRVSPGCVCDRERLCVHVCVN